MATEITCVLWGANGSSAGVEGVGGPGWTEDIGTVVGAIEEGRRYYVRLGSVQVNVVPAERGPCPLRTDPAETEQNELLSLPTCLLSLKTPVTPRTSGSNDAIRDRHRQAVDGQRELE